MNSVIHQDKALSPFVAAYMVSVALCTLGLILTITIILWFIGIPLMMLGAAIFFVTMAVHVIYAIIRAIKNEKIRKNSQL